MEGTHILVTWITRLGGWFAEYVNTEDEATKKAEELYKSDSIVEVRIIEGNCLARWREDPRPNGQFNSHEVQENLASLTYDKGVPK